MFLINCSFDVVKFLLQEDEYKCCFISDKTLKKKDFQKINK